MFRISSLPFMLLVISINSYSLEMTCKSEDFTESLRIILNKTTLEASSQAALVILPVGGNGATPISYAADIGKTKDRVNKFQFTSGKPFDWRTETGSKCWVRNGVDTTVLVKEFDEGGLGGTIFAFPRIEFDPRSKDCEVPESERAEIFSSKTIECKISTKPN